MIDTLVASVTLQLKVELPPDWIVGGVATKLEIVGAGVAAVTVTVACEVRVPPALVAVSVYVVVTVGVTCLLPLAATAPTP